MLYGAAEFSRDVDLAVDPDSRNLGRLRTALAELAAEPVYVPPLGKEALERGHACHFRSAGESSRDVRIDVMSVMRSCDPFAALWARRRRLRLPRVGPIPVLDLPDLVRAKKTQRDKDWPMIRRLVEADYLNRPARPSARQIGFWLREARTPDLLRQLVENYAGAAKRAAQGRAAVRQAVAGDLVKVARALRDEEDQARAEDRAYWEPLRAELFHWRQQRRQLVPGGFLPPGEHC